MSMHHLPALLLAAALTILTPASALALRLEKTTVPKAQDIPRATLGWDKIADVKEIEIKVKNGTRLRAVFGPAVQRMAGQSLTLGGYIIPLEQTERSTHFLLSALAPSCPFCPPPGAADVVEVRTKEPVTFTYDLVVLTGTVRLTPDDENCLYYHLDGAGMAPKG
ncbi:DUF3299 domain-containing protein [Nitrospirillum iridis]|uniref:DUF3299 domain-containing protein n=1 Tax=Nitrospirillum iridis TaxID=765888 RepID=A0A7X0B3H2_9PROT|nr:DUF3299 domain-containing protein [Nitrospirillum iridis]MBB6255052.1 hypothetical protein [Nitrospirillum iridis]